MPLPNIVGGLSLLVAEGFFMNVRNWVAAAIVLWFVPSAYAQAPAAATPPADEGIPVASELVRAKCGSCHRADDKMRMSRISYRRATPENWEKTIKRMVVLNHATLEPADARAILKYLADHNGLAPEEVRPITFEAERRLVDYTYDKDKDTSDTCSSCHSFARVLSERRTKQEWELLVAMHRGYYPLVDNQPMNGGQGFRRSCAVQTEPGPDGRPPDNRHPMDKALEHLTKTLPLNTPEWSGWSAAMRPAKLLGRWSVTGSMVGKGAIYGQVTITADPATPDGFVTETRYTIARTGETVSRSARPSSTRVISGEGATSGADAWREVLFVERDWKTMWGRWFAGAYDETGVDVKLVKAGTDTRCSARASAHCARVGAGCQDFGSNLPVGLEPEDIGIGPGVKVARSSVAARESRSKWMSRRRRRRRARRRGGGCGQALGARRLRQDRRHQGAARRVWRASAATCFRSSSAVRGVGINYGPTASRHR